MQVLLLHCVAVPSSYCSTQRCSAAKYALGSSLHPAICSRCSLNRRWRRRSRSAATRTFFHAAWRPRKRHFPSKTTTRTDPRRHPKRSESISRQVLWLSFGCQCCLAKAACELLKARGTQQSCGTCSIEARARLCNLSLRETDSALQKARESRLAFRRKTRDPGAAAPKRIADPAAPYTRTLPRQRVSPRNPWRKR